MLTINIIMVSKTLPQVVVNTLKCSNFFICSLSINSCISLIFTLARLNLLRIIKYLLEVSVMVSRVVALFHMQLNNSLGPLELMAIRLLVNYFILKWIKHTEYYVWNNLYMVVVSTIFHDFVMSTGIS